MVISDREGRENVHSSKSKRLHGSFSIPHFSFGTREEKKQKANEHARILNRSPIAGRDVGHMHFAWASKKIAPKWNPGENLVFHPLVQFSGPACDLDCVHHQGPRPAIGEPLGTRAHSFVFFIFRLRKFQKMGSGC